MAMDRPIYSVRVNPIHGNGIDTYCKISQYEYMDDSKSSYTLSFGTGAQRYCLTVSINGMDYSTAYIDRVDRVEACSKGGLSKIVNGMIKLVPLGLYTITRMCPWVKRFTLKDNSRIVCNDKDGPAISLAYDSILKYNVTWYQKNFGARLEGLVGAANETTETFSSSLGDFHAVKGSPMARFFTCLRALEHPCYEWENIQDHFPEMRAYHDLYMSSTTIREFLLRIRSQYHDAESFCNGVSPWFDNYMDSILHISVFSDGWFIPIEQVREPEGFAVEKQVDAYVLNAPQKVNVTQGGLRGTKRRKKTRSRLMGMVGGMSRGCGVMSYQEVEAEF
jgi:hypothetical protein